MGGVGFLGWVPSCPLFKKAAWSRLVTDEAEFPVFARLVQPVLEVLQQCIACRLPLEPLQPLFSSPAASLSCPQPQICLWCEFLKHIWSRKLKRKMGVRK